MAVYLSRSYLDLKKIFTRKRQSIIFHGETNTDGGKKRALIRTVSVLFAAFHPLISKCFNMTVLSLFTMWETRGNCTLRQLAVFARTHKHTHSLSFFPCGISGPPVCVKCPASSPSNRHKGHFGARPCGCSKRCCSLPGGAMAQRGLSCGHCRRSETGALRVGFGWSGGINFPRPVPRSDSCDRQ